jgi:hypothetical protein
MRLTLALLVLVSCIVVAIIVYALFDAREAARESACQGHLNQLFVAIHKYEFEHGQLPPAFILGPDGQPWHSWRVLLLPYLEEQSVYDRYRFDEPWNGPNNRKLADQIHVEVFQCFSGTDYKRTFNTNILVVVGEGTAFPFETTARSSDFRDGVENTILLLKVADSGIHWMEPRDLQFDSLVFSQEKSDAPAISSFHPTGTAVVFADRLDVYRIPRPLRNETLQALLTIDGGELITRASLIQSDAPRSLVEEAGKMPQQDINTQK